MTHVDVIAHAIDWLDACKSNIWQSVADLYAANARVAIPGALLRGSTTVLHGISDITAYWRETFDKAPRAAFELVELYPAFQRLARAARALHEQAAVRLKISLA